MQVELKTTNEFAVIPTYATLLSAGADIYSVDDAVLEPGERRIIHTGMFIALPPGYEAQVRPRSGLAAKYGITVLNSPGTIDADYRGEVGVILINLGHDNFTIHRGDRIAQLVIAKHERAEFILKDELSDTERGAGGFGSSGV